MAFLSWFIETLLQWYVWLPVVLVLAYLTWRNYQQIDAVKSVESVLLVFEIPENSDSQASNAEQMFNGLHDILRDKEELRKNGGVQEHMSFEIVAREGRLHFYAWVPKSLQSFIESHIQSQYPSVHIYEAEEDYVAQERKYSVVYTGELTLTDSTMVPIKTYTSIEADTLASTAAMLGKLEPQEQMWIQVMARPINDDWHKYSKQWVDGIKNGSPFDFGGGAFDMRWIGEMFASLWRPPQSGGASTPRALSDRDTSRTNAAEDKAQKVGFKVRIRVVYLGNSQASAKVRSQALMGTFKQFNQAGLNSFKLGKASFNKEDLSRYKSRLFLGGGFVLNSEELASVFHLPHYGIPSAPLSWSISPPQEGDETPVAATPTHTLPILTGNQAIDENISAFGLTNSHGIDHQFGLLRADRSRHVYIIGQTGTGKTATLELLTLSDIYHHQGYAIIDPHGDFAANNLRFIPGSRLKDVVYFNPSDTAWPLGFNPLEVTNPDQKATISSELIGVFKRMFGNSWGPRLEYILRYAILALLERPDATMLDITRMLTDKKFRENTLSYCNDAVVLQFWNTEFNSWNDRFQSEAIAPVLNKVGAFTANPVIRNIIGQPKSTFNIREIMDEGKILIVNLSKGLIGEDNAAILGSLLVTKIQLAAMSRSDIPNIQDRRPFYLYVDEFQNFATDSFATILSEARKYGLNLTVANQYISQMTPTVRDAVFGNVGTLVCFRVSGEDGALLSREFEPHFTSSELVALDNRHFVATMVIDGAKIPPFKATTLELPVPQLDNINQIIDYTRQQFAKSREEVEQTIAANLSSYSPKPSTSSPQHSSEPTESKRRRPRHRSKRGAADNTSPASPLPPPQLVPLPAIESPLVKDATKLRIRHKRQHLPQEPIKPPQPAHDHTKLKIPRTKPPVAKPAAKVQQKESDGFDGSLQIR